MSTKYVNYVSPKGTAKYPKLDQPYSWNQAANRSMPDPDGQYELKMIMPSKEFAPFKAVIDDAIKQSGIKPKNLPYKKEVDRDTDEPTGNVEVTFRAYGKDRLGKQNRLGFVDSKGNPMPSTVRITSGSVLKVSGWVSVAAMGARLNIRRIQVISLVEEASEFTPEDGYEYDGSFEETTTNNTTETTVEAAQSSDDEDFDF